MHFQSIKYTFYLYNWSCEIETPKLLSKYKKTRQTTKLASSIGSHSDDP